MRRAPPVDVSRLPTTEQIRVVHVEWRALDVGSDLRPGEAVMYSDAVTPADFGNWALPLPGGLDAARVTGGDVGLTPRLSLRLVGVQQLDPGASGMITGLEYRLSEPGPWRVSVIGGYLETLSRARALWTEALVSYRSGRWQYGASVRQEAAVAGSAPEVTAVAGASYGSEPFRVGLEYVSGAARSVVTQALMPSVSTVVDRKVTIKATSTLGLHGVATSPARVSVSSAF